jgi:hypothetical protein
VKSHPRLLVRDALAELFCDASSGEAQALAAVDALARWRERPQSEPALARLRAERDRPLFAADGQLADEYAGQGDYVRDRALRFAAACSWLREEGGLGDALASARAAWDAGLFFEVHERLEPIWLSEPPGPRRDALQGLIMAGAALHHLCEANLAGARALLREAARKLHANPQALEVPWDLARFAAQLHALSERIARGEVQSARDIDALPALGS